MSQSRENKASDLTNVDSATSFPLEKFVKEFPYGLAYLNTRGIARLAKTSVFFRNNLQTEIEKRKKLFEHYIQNAHIACGNCYSILTTFAGEVYAAGWDIDKVADKNNEIDFPFQTIDIAPFTQVIAPNNKAYFLMPDKTVQFVTFKKGKISAPNTIPELKNIIKMASCSEYALFLDEFGDIYQADSDNSQSINQINSTTPQKIQSMANVKDIIAGANHTLILLHNGDVFSFGNNWCGQLGVGQHHAYLLPLQKMATSVVQIAAGTNHSIILTQDGKLMACGHNGYGQLGLGHQTDYDTLQPILLSADIKQIAANGDFSLFLTKDGNVYVCGDNRYAQLGLGDQMRIQPTPKLITNLPPIEKLFMGPFHTFAMSQQGQLYGWGHNERGNLFLDEKQNKFLPTKISLNNFDKLPEVEQQSSITRPKV